LSFCHDAKIHVACVDFGVQRYLVIVLLLLVGGIFVYSYILGFLRRMFGKGPRR